jgi:hypothetical protein
MAVFWDVAPCRLVKTDLRFRGAYRLRHQGDCPVIPMLSLKDRVANNLIQLFYKLLMKRTTSAFGKEPS